MWEECDIGIRLVKAKYALWNLKGFLIRELGTLKTKPMYKV